ncbi:MAG: lipoyl synthase [Clostridium argentinense]|uniref:Lipoyl synthase n=2 Tax=Clostridium faecium TaxID=2762223 RepID=A0ABR8YML9_9CLOT|nr:lipoyl synthase [Clostridium faecium]MBS5824412.1 lipoyl synthase [Clostridium argentinense]
MEYIRKPEWLKIKLQGSKNINKVNSLLNQYKLNTVCEEAGCPNHGECYNKCTAAFMILGKNCSRNCRFCKVTKEAPESVDPMEPYNLAQTVNEMNLKHVVITSVTRDDLPDGGASHFSKSVEEIKKLNKNTTIEVLIPDFKGDIEALKTVISSSPEIINHNIETVKSLYSKVRPMAVYERSLELLQNVKDLNSDILTKSGFMVGLGETEEEVIELMKDLRKVNCDILTIGQYLMPSKKHINVVEYIHPDTFKKYELIGKDLGFKFVASGPLVRSSYYAEEVFESLSKI